MKIEKLTENKIRIILKQEDFKDKTINIQKLLLSTEESQSLFLEILNKAKTEVNFDTDGYKLLIEAHFENDDVFVFTITKYLENINNHNNQKKYLTVKRKKHVYNSAFNIYQFESFENFCDFCDFINKNINIKGLFKTSSLYYYNTYYLIIEGFNFNHKSINAFFSSIYEFGNFVSYTKHFKFKLNEHGKIIFKNKAINETIKFFSTK